MRQLIWTLAGATLLLAIAPGEGEAVSTLTFKVAVARAKDGGEARASIYAGPEGVMTLGGHGWKSIAFAREAADRLNMLAEEGLGPDEITIRTERRTPVLMARGQRILAIDKPLAAAQGSDRQSLARVWARNLRTQFGKPYLSVAPVVVPVGETRTAPVRGKTVGEVAVRAQGPAVAASWDEAGRKVRVLGLQPGRTELIIEDEANAICVPVRAAKYAARLVGRPAAGVTGSPASPVVVERAVRAAVGASLSIEPGAWVMVTPSRGETSALWPGKATRVTTSISAAGPEYLPFHDRAAVAVRNEPLRGGPPELLMVSNYPERLAGHGLWFEGRVQGSRAVRLLYHHVNAAGVPADLVVELWNLGPEMARIHVLGGAAGPSSDEVYVGHRAAAEFLTNRAGAVGWVVPVPPGMVAPVMSQPMSPGSVASGVLELRPLAPVDLTLRLYLAPPVSERLPRPVAGYSESPLLGQWQYPETRREVRARYEVGGEWAFVTIGDQPASGLAEGDLLAGSYGILYDIELELANPTAEPAKVGLLIEPAGGPARAAVLVDGEPVETALLRRQDEGMVARYTLAPGQVRKVRLQTMPQGGSSYPVRLVARPI